MENVRGEESRNGYPDHSGRGHEKRQAPVGFEGMNFEQKRKPYGEGHQTSNDPGERGRELFNDRENQ
jgi:hypothetical protein